MIEGMLIFIVIVLVLRAKRSVDQFLRELAEEDRHE
jgi:hypothetical protein